jgi:hypothetical protein
MNEPQGTSERQKPSPGRIFIILGLFLFWAASIGLALDLQTLLTPGNFPIGSDPSFDISLAAFCFLVCLLGAVFTWRGTLMEEGNLRGKIAKNINTATIFLGVFLVFVFIAGGLLYSANSAFAAQFKPFLLSEPRPDYNVPDFPTPILPQPTPTYDPAAKYLAGPITSAMDGLKVGSIWIGMSPGGETVHYIQIYLDPIVCSVQTGGSVASFAVNQSQQLLDGPIQVQNGNFYASQDMAVLHGIIVSSTEAHGTLYLHYIDPASRRSCDLGNFDWDATISGQR